MIEYVVYGHPDENERDSLCLTHPENTQAVAMELDDGHIHLYSIMAEDFETAIRYYEQIEYGESTR